MGVGKREKRGSSSKIADRKRGSETQDAVAAQAIDGGAD